MPVAGKIFNFFVYSNLFIAACAVCMVNHTCALLLNKGPGVHLPAFVFFATICSYSFHWYLTPSSQIPSLRTEWVNRNRKIYILFFFAGLIGSAVFFLYLLDYWPWLLISAITTFLYSAPKIPNKHFRALRKIALGKTIFLALVWTYVTVALPVVVNGNEWHPDFYLYAFSRFFLIYAICILFDYRDREDDKGAGIRSLITYLSEQSIIWLFIISLGIFFITTLLLLYHDYSVIMVVLLLIPGILTASLYNYARRHFSDMFYYFVLDGLMALSALLMLVARI
jgi:4-hydroxybenzoate polyprenyltransferase